MALLPPAPRFIHLSQSSGTRATRLPHSLETGKYLLLFKQRASLIILSPGYCHALDEEGQVDKSL